MSIKVLPSMEHTFTIKVEGSETGQLFEGTFTYKRPNIRTRSEINKTAAILDGGIKNLDEDTKFLHTVFATLQNTLITYPEWWEKSDFGFELYDVNVALEIYKEIQKFRDEWDQKVLFGEEKPTKSEKSKK